jgi:F0F1-type ATP synthase membrane subunit b/b'
MTPNEISFVKHITSIIEKKHDEIVELSIAESQNEIDQVRKEWNKKYGELQDKYDFIIESLKRDGFINDEIRKMLSIPSSSQKL